MVLFVVQLSYPPSVIAEAYVPNSTVVGEGRVLQSAVCQEAWGYSQEEGPLDDGSAAHLYLY